jgi:hypothetical protein
MIRVNVVLPTKLQNRKRRIGIQYVGPCVNCPLRGECAMDSQDLKPAPGAGLRRHSRRHTRSFWRKADGETLDCIRQAQENCYN